MNIESRFELGQGARDTISGFVGVVYGITVFLNGCVRIGLAPKGLHDGKPIDTQWFDEPQLEAHPSVEETAERLRVAASGGGGTNPPGSHARP